jgi:nitrile hydratase
MMRAVQATGKFRIGLRPPIESMPPADYLRMPYYEIWLTSLIERMVASDIVTRGEIESGRPVKGSEKTSPALSPADAPLMPFKVPQVTRVISAEPRFQVGQRVRALNINPVTHTRLPRYARGKTGTVDHVRGVFVFPDTAVYSKGEKPQHVYSVRFGARELWGNQAAPQDAVYLDMWEDYLEAA